MPIVRYIGNVEFEPTSDPVFGVDFFGIDGARWKFKGAAPKLKAFEDSQNKFSPLSGHGLMYLLTWTNDDDPVFPSVELVYTGFRKSLPPVRAVDGKSIQTLTTGITPTAGTFSGKKLSLEISYRASRTTWKWYETSKPATRAKYALVRNPIDPLQEIISWRVSDDRGAVQTLSTGDFTALLNTFRASVIVNDYQVEDIIPAKIWACESSADYGLVLV